MRLILRALPPALVESLQEGRLVLFAGAGLSVIDKPYAVSVGVTPQTAGVVTDGCHSGFGRRLVDGWIGPFESFTVGDETITHPKIRFAELWKHTTQTEIGTRLPSHTTGMIRRK